MTVDPPKTVELVTPSVKPKKNFLDLDLSGIEDEERKETMPSTKATNKLLEISIHNEDDDDI